MSKYIRIAVAVGFAAMVLFAIPQSYHLPLLGLVMAMVVGEQLLARYQKKAVRSDKKKKKKLRLFGHSNDKIVGKFFEVEEWNLLFRPFMSAVGAVIVVIFLALFDIGLRFATGIPGLPMFAYLAIWSLAFLYFVSPDIPADKIVTEREKKRGDEARKGMEVVPPVYVAMVTWWGKALRWYRGAGEYTWEGSRLWFGRINNPVEKITEVNATDEDGFFYTGDITMRLWNSSKEVGQTKLVTPAKDGSEVSTTVVLTFSFYDIMKWIENSNPILDIGERARAALRAAIGFFTTRDNASVKNALPRLLSGEYIVTAFINSPTEGHKARSVIRNESGFPMYDPVVADVIDDPTEEEVAQAQINFLKRIREQATPEMIKAVTRADTSLAIEVITLNETLIEVLTKVGVRLGHTSVGEMSFSDPVKREANEAASEEWQADARKQSAAGNIAAVETMAEFRKKIGPQAFDSIMRYVAAEDNPESVRMINIGGLEGEATAGAIVAAADTLNKKSDENKQGSGKDDPSQNKKKGGK